MKLHFTTMLLYLCLTINTVGALFGESFTEYLKEIYGKDAERLIRSDLGDLGSFGGGNHISGTTTSKTPVIFVHGYRTCAGDNTAIANYFKENGNFTDPELYATTYGVKVPGSKGISVIQDGVNCLYVKDLRNLIEAVNGFTNSRVDIIAASMGSPVARKAILGGKCVDTGDNLGDSLELKVRKFVSVCGANRGSIFCENATSELVCNKETGLRCGSKVLKDLERPKRYEGEKSYLLESKADKIVGYIGCGNINLMEFLGISSITVYDKLSHIQTFFKTYDQQLKYIQEEM